MTPIDRRSEILDMIRQCVCVDRCKTHGEAEVNLAHLADVWRWWIKARHGIDVPLDSLDSSQMMSLSKVSRKACNPYVVDHWADDAGYDVIGAGIVKKALDEQAMKKELDGLAPAVDHGEEELKKSSSHCTSRDEWSECPECGTNLFLTVDSAPVGCHNAECKKHILRKRKLDPITDTSCPI